MTDEELNRILAQSDLEYETIKDKAREYDELTKSALKLNEIVKEQNKEIERLNNIINKIIEFLQREQIEKGEYCDFLIENKQIKVQEVLDKIKELKGSDKE